MEGIVLPGEKISFDVQTRVNYRKDLCKRVTDTEYVFTNPSKVEETSGAGVGEEDAPSRQVRVRFIGEIYVPRAEDVVIGTVVRRFASMSFVSWANGVDRVSWFGRMMFVRIDGISLLRYLG